MNFTTGYLFVCKKDRPGRSKPGEINTSRQRDTFSWDLINYCNIVTTSCATAKRLSLIMNLKLATLTVLYANVGASGDATGLRIKGTNEAARGGNNVCSEAFTRFIRVVTISLR